MDFTLQSKWEAEVVLAVHYNNLIIMQATQSLCSFKSAVAVRPKASLRGELAPRLPVRDDHLRVARSLATLDRNEIISVERSLRWRAWFGNV